MNKKFISFQGKKISYTLSGKGKVLVLLHGFTESQAIWEDFSEQLSSQCRVITLDLPGHGESECISDIHSMELMADCVKQVLDETEVKKCCIIGHSMGGYAALAFAEKYPGMVSGLGLFHSSALADDEEARERRQKTIEFVKKNHVSFVTEFIPDLFAPENRGIYKKEIETLVSGARKMSAASIVAALAGMRDRPDRTSVLKVSEYPVLFILGKLDSRVNHQKAMEQAALPDDAVIVSLGKTGHMGYIEARDKTLYAVKVFMDGITDQ